MQERPYQVKFGNDIAAAYDAGIRRMLASSATGTGKCLAKGTPVLMFDGTVLPVESLSVGALLMGPDSRPRTVMSLASGVDELYDIVPTKGEKYTVNAEHILSLKLTPKRKQWRDNRFVEISVKEYLKKSKTFKHRAKGHRAAIDFTEKTINLDPYFLGLWLGDGNSNSPAITTMDEELRNYVALLCANAGLFMRTEPLSDNAASTYYITSHKKGSRLNTYRMALRALGVWNNKHVPTNYKINSRSVRLNVLAGYLDADGHLSDGGFEFVSVSRQLAQDICFIARSLGFACYLKPCKKTCQTGATGNYYRGFISGDVAKIPCKLSRKQAPERKQIKDVLVTGIRVLPAGKGEYFGFTLDGDGLFVLGDFTVTHNTVMFSQLYEKMKSRLPGQMLVLAHREELIDQNIAKMRLVNPTLRVDKEMAEHKADPSQADVIVASVATLGRKGTKRVEKYNWERIDKVIVDEAHHSTADSYRNIFALTRSLEPTSQGLLLGVTATPQRSDGKALAELYERVVFVYSIREAITDGWLVDIRGYRVRTDTDLSGVEKSRGDFAADQLADAVNTPERNRKIVAAWFARAENRQTVAFCAGIKHAQDLAHAFREAGVEAEAVWGDDQERSAKLKAHRDKEITVICNCGVLVEGYDDWRIGCVLLARPTQSSVLFTQMVGRGTRLQEGIGCLKGLVGTPEWLSTIKSDCIVLDVVDNSSKHSLITLPTLMGLPGTLDLKGKSVVGSVELIEQAQIDNPSVDFSKLQSITELKQFIESINLFEVRFPAEVEENSELTWYRAAGGGYRIAIPKSAGGGYCRISQNMLDQWQIEGELAGRTFRGTGAAMDGAFKKCDELIRERCPDILNIISRSAKWHGQKATANQMTILRRLFKGRVFPELTKGAASRLIGERLARKA
jgi:superfamily II DNA or RNA helicase